MCDSALTFHIEFIPPMGVNALISEWNRPEYLGWNKDHLQLPELLRAEQAATVEGAGLIL